MAVMHKKSVHLLYVLILPLFFHKKTTHAFISGTSRENFGCIERERQALLKLKEDFIDDYGILSTWGSEEEKIDCCKWRGVWCNNRTSHVTLLDLHSTSDEVDDDYMPLRGKISDSLAELHHLIYLDLSNNEFSSCPFPNFIGNLSRLRYLNLSSNGCTGIPSYQLGNLSRLQSLDLSTTVDVSPEGLDWLSHLSSLEHLALRFNDLTNASNWLQYHLRNFSKLKSLDLQDCSVNFEKLDWLSDLSSLEYLDLSYNNLSMALDWLQAVNSLPRLKYLLLSQCSLPRIIPSSLSLISSSKSLATIDLFFNNLSSSIYPWLYNFNNSLVELDLSGNLLQGPLQDAFRNMSSLRHLNLSYNQLQGIPRFCGETCSLRTLDLFSNTLTGELSTLVQNLHGQAQNSLEVLRLGDNGLGGSLADVTIFSSLKELDLSHNQLNGSIPESIGSLSKLKYLDVSWNSLHGVVSEVQFSNLSKLQRLDLSYNSLDLKFRSDWIPPFQLDVIHLSNINLGPHFPNWLQHQNNFSELDISGARISGTVPNWFWHLSPKFDLLNLSYNLLSGTLPDLSSIDAKCPGIDLSFNQFEGPLPLFPSNTTSLDLSNNMFSGSISFLCDILDVRLLCFLDLSNNLLSGPIPDCFFEWNELVVLNLANNSLSGAIPSSMGLLFMLESLSLHNNNLSGDLPLSLKNCSSLIFLDLSENSLSGEIPVWIGESLSSLLFLSVQSNKFYGNIPQQLCQLRYIRILDLSLNNFSGNIPNCLENITAMVQTEGSNDIINHFYAASYFYMISSRGAGLGRIYIDKALIGWKGREYQYEKNLGLLRIIDFSGNILAGEIPEQISGLFGLVALNLSGNHLIGVIPQAIGHLKQLEALDLSRNQLSGVIPATMADLNFLSYLNLSYNDLSGKIPTSTQLQSLDDSAFIRNVGLCGPPVTQKCPGNDPPQGRVANGDSLDNTEDEFSKWFYAGMELGFVAGFWGISGALLLKRSFRHAYFRFLDKSRDWLSATTLSRLPQKFQRK